MVFKRLFLASLIIIGLFLVGSPPVIAGAADTLVIAFPTDFVDLDPHSHHVRENMIRDINQFDSLLAKDAETAQPIPSLAESWEVIDDLTWEFYLRQDVTFHNGDPFTAKDVKFSIERILDPDFGSPQYGRLSPIKEVVVIDDYTVQIITEEPWPLLLENMTYSCIIPMDYYMEVGPEVFSNEAPIGTGPYMHVEWRRDQYLLQERYEDHWRGPAPFKFVRYRIIPERATRLAELMTGGVHVIRDVPPDLIEDLEKNPDTYISAAPILRTHRYFFDTRTWPMSNRDFRQACNYAIDWELIIEELLYGWAGRLATNIAPMAFGFHPDLEPYPYDPDKARELLEKSGYYDDPQEIPFHVAVPDPFRDIAEVAIANLEEVGININPIFWEYGPSWLSLRNSGQLEPGIWTGAWGYYSLFDSIGIMEPDFDSEVGLFGRFYWNDPEVDELLDLTRRTVDHEKRKEAFFRIQEIVHEEAPLIFQFHQYEILGLHKDVEAVARPDEFLWLMDIKPTEN